VSRKKKIKRGTRRGKVACTVSEKGVRGFKEERNVRHKKAGHAQKLRKGFPARAA